MEAITTITWKRAYGNSGRLKTLRYISLLCAVLLAGSHGARAQQPDSLAIYKKIKCIADKRPFTQWMYQAIFVEPRPLEYPSEPDHEQGKIVNPYLKYSGRVIRSVRITVYDPFGCSVNDTLCHKMNFFEKIGNRTHITTRTWVIRNKLLFKENDKMNPLAISESERLLRQSVYISDARIFVKRANKDTVDVEVFVQDKWSVTIPGEITTTVANATYRNDNLLGTGQQFQQYVDYKKPGLWDYKGSYTIANIDGLFMSSRLSYDNNKDGTNVGLTFDRPFYSPLADWAGGLGLSHGQHFFGYTDTVDYRKKQVNVKDVGYDVWYGRSIKLKPGTGIFSQSNNIIAGGRYYGAYHFKRPSADIDVVRTFPNARAFIGNVGFALQQYYKGRYIYRFGANEDVPEGLIMQLLYGALKTELDPVRYYAGAELARARHYDIGYLSATVSGGMFFNRYIKTDITTLYKLHYFSDLIKLGRWYMRQFNHADFIWGVNKPVYEKLTLTAGDLYGFSSGALNGNSKLVFQSETVLYAPYNLAGFRFAPVLDIGLGMIGDDRKKLPNSDVYQGYALGLMMRNENLLVSTFQVSVGLYPFLPGGGSYVLKYNPVTSFTLRVRAFSVTKPAFLSY